MMVFFSSKLRMFVISPIIEANSSIDWDLSVVKSNLNCMFRAEVNFGFDSNLCLMLYNKL